MRMGADRVRPKPRRVVFGQRPALHQQLARPRRAELPESVLNPRFTFNRFITGSENALVFAAVQSIFERDHPGCADQATIDAFAKAICALDDSMPNGTYIDMTSKLPVVDPEKITVPTILMRGQWDGIASMDDVV